MIHVSTKQNGHYAVNVNCNGEFVLLQLGDVAGNQVRLQLTSEEVKHLIELLNESESKLRN